LGRAACVSALALKELGARINTAKGVSISKQPDALNVRVKLVVIGIEKYTIVCEAAVMTSISVVVWQKTIGFAVEVRVSTAVFMNVISEVLIAVVTYATKEHVMRVTINDPLLH
jgi:hypothetical protein